MNTSSYPRITRGVRAYISIKASQLNITKEQLESFDRVHITFSQMDRYHPNGAVVCKLGLNNEVSIDVDNDSISCELTDYETRRFQADRPLRMQLIQTDDEGISFVSDILNLRVNDNLCPGHNEGD